MAQLVARGQLREIRVRHRVALEVDQPGVLHLMDLFPRQIVWIDAREIVDEEDRCLESIFFQDWIGILVVVNVPVIEGNDDRLCGERRTAFRRVHHLVQRDRMVALFCKVCHLLVKLVAVQCEWVAVLVLDLMVVEHGHAGGCAHEQHRSSETQENQNDRNEQPTWEFHWNTFFLIEINNTLSVAYPICSVKADSSANLVSVHSCCLIMAFLCQIWQKKEEVAIIEPSVSIRKRRWTDAHCAV